MNDLEALTIGNVSLSVAYISEPVSLPDNIVTEKPCKGSLNKCMYACMYVCNMGYTGRHGHVIYPALYQI